MAYTPKTTQTDQPVESFLQTVSDSRRQEAYQLIALMERVSGEPAKMWGPSMIGFGKYHYVSKSKSEADWFKIGFSPRKPAISLYVSCDADEFTEQLAEMGPHTRGRGCIYIKRLADIDMTVLEQIVTIAYAQAKDWDATKQNSPDSSLL